MHIELIVAGARLPDPEGAILEPETEHTGGAGAPVDPQHKGDSGR